MLSWSGWRGDSRICRFCVPGLRPGSLRLDQVDAISKLATPDTEEAVIAECLGLSNAALDRAARRANPPSTQDAVDGWRERWLSIQYTLDGIRAQMTSELPGAEMALVESEIRARADRIPVNPETGIFDPYPQRMADGLVELATTTGDENPSGPTQIVVHADLEALTEDPTTTGVAEIQGGPVIANETARRLSCDPIVECAVYDHEKVLGIGRRSRLIPGWLTTSTVASGRGLCLAWMPGNTFRACPSQAALGRLWTH